MFVLWCLLNLTRGGFGIRFNYQMFRKTRHPINMLIDAHDVCGCHNNRNSSLKQSLGLCWGYRRWQTCFSSVCKQRSNNYYQMFSESKTTCGRYSYCLWELSNWKTVTTVFITIGWSCSDTKTTYRRHSCCLWELNNWTTVTTVFIIIWSCYWMLRRDFKRLNPMGGKIYRCYSVWV